MDTNSKINSKDALFLILITIITVFLRSENNIYIQFFPEIIDLFKIDPDDANYILRVNFFGALFGLIVGPISDSYGRNKLFYIGIILYIISSLMCFLASNFYVLLIARMIEGSSGSICYIIGWILVFENLSKNKSGKILGFTKGMTTLTLALLPLFTIWIANLLNWHINFALIPILASISLIIALICLKNTKDISTKKKLNIKSFLKSYLVLLKNLQFMSYTLVYSLSMSIYILFFSNASIIYINHSITTDQFSYYQTLNSIIYVIFSFLSVYIIGKKGVDYTKNLGFGIFVAGSILTFITSHLYENAHIMLTISLIMCIGSALMNGFLLKAISLFPDMKGSAMSLNATIKIILSARLIFWSQTFFNETIIPTTSIIFICTIFSIILLTILKYRKKKELSI